MTAIHDSFPENAGAGGDWGRRLFACAKRMLVYFQCMAFVTLTINTEAHSRLKKLKAPGDSFSDVILRELPEPWETAGDVLDGLERMQVPRRILNCEQRSWPAGAGGRHGNDLRYDLPQ